jgi:hypothetical protein
LPSRESLRTCEALHVATKGGRPDAVPGP